MDVPAWVWLVTVAAVLVLFLVDFYAHVRTPHFPTFRESAVWSAVYIGLALLFGVGLLAVAGPDRGGEYFAGYLTEKSLSVDNLFVFLIIMTRFRVPRDYQQKVLLVGVGIALVLRGLFIWAGAAAIENFSWVFYIFGAFLVYTAVKTAREDHDDADEAASEYHEGRALRLVRRVVPSTELYHDDKLTTRIGGRLVMTPMLVVMIAIGSTDVLFALDSIPAIYGLTVEPYIVFTTNAFALLGLRQLYFLLGGLLARLIYLSQGLAVILGFIGAKLILEALHSNEVPFVNGGRPVEWAPQIPIWVSLTVILGTLAVATVASLVVSRNRARQVAVAERIPEELP